VDGQNEVKKEERKEDRKNEGGGRGSAKELTSKGSCPLWDCLAEANDHTHGVDRSSEQPMRQSSQ